jgi:hypothetical protein
MGICQGFLQRHVWLPFDTRTTGKGKRLDRSIRHKHSQLGARNCMQSKHQPDRTACAEHASDCFPAVTAMPGQSMPAKPPAMLSCAPSCPTSTNRCKGCSRVSVLLFILKLRAQFSSCKPSLHSSASLLFALVQPLNCSACRSSGVPLARRNAALHCLAPGNS